MGGGGGKPQDPLVFPDRTRGYKTLIWVETGRTEGLLKEQMDGDILRSGKGKETLSGVITK